MFSVRILNTGLSKEVILRIGTTLLARFDGLNSVPQLGFSRGPHPLISAVQSLLHSLALDQFTRKFHLHIFQSSEINSQKKQLPEASYCLQGACSSDPHLALALSGQLTVTLVAPTQDHRFHIRRSHWQI